MFYVDLTNEEVAKNMRKEADDDTATVEKEKSKNGEKSGN